MASAQEKQRGSRTETYRTFTFKNWVERKRLRNEECEGIAIERQVQQP
jgi:hypothetical protein